MCYCLTREKQIRAIEESFEAAKLPPVHQTKHEMEAEWVLPLFPCFERYTNCISFLYTSSKNLFHHDVTYECQHTHDDEF
jgi:hypothetical protein